MVMEKNQIMALSRQFFIETRGGIKPSGISSDTYLRIQENIKSIEQVRTPGVKRMLSIFKDI